MIDIDKDESEFDEEEDEKDEQEEVDEYAGLNGNYDEYYWEGFSIAQKAAAAGDYQRVKVLLMEGLEKYDVKRAFRAAAFNDRMDVAWLLVEAGAGFYSYEDNEIWVYCPVCLTTISTHDGAVCWHWVCLYTENEYYWFDNPNFESEVAELAQWLRRKYLADEDFERIARRAPDSLRILFKQARKHHELYWTKKGQVLTVEYDSPGWCPDHCCNYFHPDGGFAQRVKEEAQDGLVWLKQYFPVLFVNEVEMYDSYGKEDEWDDLGEDRAAVEKNKYTLIY